MDTKLVKTKEGLLVPDHALKKAKVEEPKKKSYKRDRTKMKVLCDNCRQPIGGLTRYEISIVENGLCSYCYSHKKQISKYEQEPNNG